MKITLATLICLFWLVMTGLLVHREVIPSLRQAPSITYRTLLARMDFPHVDRFSLAVAGHTIGTLEADYRRLPLGEGFEIRNTLKAKPHLASAPLASASWMAIPDIGEIEGSWTLLLDDRYQPVRLGIHAEAPAMGLGHFEAQGWFKEDLLLSYRTNGGNPHALSLNCPPGMLFGLGFGWLGTLRDLHVGKTWTMTMVDLASSLMDREVRTLDLCCKVTAFTSRRIDGREVPIFTVEARSPGGAIDLWFSHTGELIRACMPGIELVRLF